VSDRMSAWAFNRFPAQAHRQNTTSGSRDRLPCQWLCGVLLQMDAIATCVYTHMLATRTGEKITTAAAKAVAVAARPTLSSAVACCRRAIFI